MAAERNKRQIAAVIDFIGRHLDEDLSVERLAAVARMSPFHFHRQFTACAGIPVATMIELMRLKQASFYLAFDHSSSITDIAFDVGFGSPETFARAFRRVHGRSPSQFRDNPQWADWAKKYQTIAKQENNTVEVEVVTVEDELVAALEHQGAAHTLMDSVTQFIAWRKATGLSPNATSGTFGVPWSDPESVPPEQFRFDICGTVDTAVPQNKYGVTTKTIPGGRCARVRHLGSTDAIAPVVRDIYSQWLPKSGETPRDFPCYFHYIKRMPAVAEHEQVTDIYLPLA